MNNASLVGKVAYYRPLLCKELKESEVVAARKLVNLAGEELFLLKMANGDEESAASCYFDPSKD